MAKFGVPLLSLAIGALGATFASVTLQPASPGVKETGNINVSGTVIGTKFMAGLSSSASIITAYSPNSGTTAVQGTTKNFGVRGQSTATSGLAYGGYFDTTSPDGYGAWFRNKAPSGIGRAIRAESASSGSEGIAAEFVSTATTGGTTTVDVSNMSDSSSAFGLLSRASNGYAIYGEATGALGVGISGYGVNTGILANSFAGNGILAETGGPNSYAVRGTAPAGGTGHAVFASGTLAASGNKSMMIDHPDDPENKYLLQFCTEGDTPQLQYRGTVKLNANGAAVVDLPPYFDKINRDPICQLTAVGASMPGLYVAEKVKGNQFRIAGGKPGGEVFWTVIGIRNDRFVQRYGAQTERFKPQDKQGTYLQPELYGKPKEMGELYEATGRTGTQSPPPRR